MMPFFFELTMRYLSWLWKLVLFLLLFGFALKNTEPSVVRYYLGFEWHAPLALVLLTFFALGAFFALLACLGFLFRQHREINALKRKLRAQGSSFAEDSE